MLRSPVGWVCHDPVPAPGCPEDASHELQGRVPGESRLQAPSPSTVQACGRGRGTREGSPHCHPRPPWLGAPVSSSWHVAEAFSPAAVPASCAAASALCVFNPIPCCVTGLAGSLKSVKVRGGRNQAGWPDPGAPAWPHQCPYWALCLLPDAPPHCVGPPYAVGAQRVTCAWFCCVSRAGSQ